MHALSIPAIMAAVGTATIIALGAPAVAAEENAAPRLAQAQSYGDAKLQSFALAALEVEAIRQEVTQQIAQTDDSEVREGLIGEANEQMIDAVESTPGISVDEYNQIAQAAEQDAELAQRISQYMQPGAQ